MVLRNEDGIAIQERELAVTPPALYNQGVDSSKTQIDFIEKNNALEGVFLPLEKRLEILDELYEQYKLLTPWKFVPQHKSFDSFSEYEQWKKQQNPWYW